MSEDEAMSEDGRSPATAGGSGHEPTLIVEDVALASGFTQIPNLILRARTLSRDAKLLYGILLSYAWQRGSCFPGYERLSDDLQCGPNQLSKWIKELRSGGFIDVKRRGQGKTSVYTIKSLQNYQNDRTRTIAGEEPELPKRKHEEDPVEEDSIEEDPSNFRLVPTQGAGAADPARRLILGYVDDVAREMADRASLKASTTRAYKLFRRSGLSVEAFADELLAARATVKERSASIRSTSREPGRAFPTKRKMGYFFAVLEDRLGLKDPPSDGRSGA